VAREEGEREVAALDDAVRGGVGVGREKARGSGAAAVAGAVEEAAEEERAGGGVAAAEAAEEGGAADGAEEGLAGERGREEVGGGGEEDEDLPQEVVPEDGDGGDGRSHVAQGGARHLDGEWGKLERDFFAHSGCGSFGFGTSCLLAIVTAQVLFTALLMLGI
jgi:hypothetical protein